jgi:hypothetical protein
VPPTPTSRPETTELAYVRSGSVELADLRPLKAVELADIRPQKPAGAA